MRISFDWLKQYIDIQESAEEVSQILTSLGLEVEALEKLGVPDEHLEGVVVGEVLECLKHPNADRLKLTKVDAGNGQILQVVCGAPNVATGQKVLLALEGATLHPTQGESFTIKKGKIRGEVSEGMICAEDELGLGQSHDGILILDPMSIVGTPAAQVVKRNHDVIFEIGLTPNRADATSHLGVAKDLLAWYRVHRDAGKKLKVWELKEIKNAKGSLNIKVTVEDPALCPRYSGICLSNITVQDSPEWLQQRIKSMGLQPINNVVDLTNFIMYEMGQPLHAFDYDQIQHHEIVVKNLPEGTAFKTLDEVERKLRAADLMICDGNDQPLCMAGVFGGIGSGVSEKTERIFIESAHFDASTVRRASMAHNLRTQSARCFEKGSDPNDTLFALERAAFLLKEICGAVVDSSLIDLYPQLIPPAEILLDTNQAIQLSGLNLDKDALKKVLFALEMELTDTQDGNLRVFVPTNKPDVKRAADLVEEICRVYGLDSIPVPETLKISFPKILKNNYFLKKKISEWLSHTGLHEIMSLSLVRSAQCIKTGIWKEEDLVFINNTSNIHLDVMKPSICLGGLEVLQYNVNRQQTDLGVFEMGKQYIRKDGTILEDDLMGVWLYGMKDEPHWNSGKPVTQDFFSLKAVFQGLFGYLNVRSFQISEIEDNSLFGFGLHYSFNGQSLAKFGRLNTDLSHSFDLKKEVWYGEVYLNAVREVLELKSGSYVDFSKFPLITRDLALVVDQKIKFEAIEKKAKDTCGVLLKEIQLFDIYRNEEQLGPGKKSMAISLTFEQQERQMTGEEIDKLMQNLIAEYEQRLGALIRR
ncbi:MAG: phenylalanine--tRNA ligase subunit beta [Saprospiraceae bacterium]|nr:phenylalanine--tRNA ligase subunit beta [Saprospiraceae bacterium]